MKNFLPVLLALCLLSFSACTEEPPQPPPFPEVPEVNYSIYLDSLITEARSTKKIPGLAIGIVRNGGIDWEAAYGKSNIAEAIEVDEKTTFMLNEGGDLFVAAIIQQLAEKGQLDLDEDINTYLPFKVKNPHFPNAIVTPRMLLTHTSGIVDNDVLIKSTYVAGDSEEDLEAFLEALLAEGGHFYLPTNFNTSRPGKTYSYSRTGIALAGFLVEAISTIEFDVYSKTHLFAKLGLSNVSWFINSLKEERIAIPYVNAGGVLNPQDNYGYAIYPSGQLRISLNQSLKFMIAMLENGNYGSQRILTAGTIAEMMDVQYPGASATQAIAWGYQTIKGKTLLGISGSDKGFSNRFYIDPSTNVGVVILTNGAGYDSALDDILVKAFEAADLQEN